MEPITALIFPDTEPALARVAKLLLFFDSLTYYLPTESDTAQNSVPGILENLCKGYVPVPLNDDLPRFNRLLRDMTAGRPEEFSRLFSANKAPMATGQLRDLDETSSAGVYSAMHKDKELQARNLYRERLWQARLILKLAEILDRKEAEIRTGLRHISANEKKIFTVLEGPEGIDTDEAASLKNFNTQKLPAPETNLQDDIDAVLPGRFIPIRAKSWAELYLADPADPLSFVIAADPDSAALLLDGYEHSQRREPLKLFTLALPSKLRVDTKENETQYLSQRDSFRKSARQNLEFFSGLLQKAATMPISSGITDLTDQPILSENIAAWEEKVKDLIPDPETSLDKLTFYGLPGLSVPALFRQVFHLEDFLPENNRTSSSGIISILTA